MQPRGVNGGSASKTSLIVADASFSEMRFEAVEEVPRHRAIIGMNLEPSIDERADQPSPYRTLLIGGIPGTHIPEIARLVLGLARR